MSDSIPIRDDGAKAIPPISPDDPGTPAREAWPKDQYVLVKSSISSNDLLRIGRYTKQTMAENDIEPDTDMAGVINAAVTCALVVTGGNGGVLAKLKDMPKGSDNLEARIAFIMEEMPTPAMGFTAREVGRLASTPFGLPKTETASKHG